MWRFDFTGQGIRYVKATAKRAAAFKEVAKPAGVALKEIYWTLGPYGLSQSRMRRTIWSQLQ
jgi:uncharacterized protein with GYD domain